MMSTPEQPLVLVALLNWNDLEETCTALESVLAMEYANFRVLIVDNGSTDGSAQGVQALGSERVEVILSPVNTGYTGGSNLAMCRALEAGAEYLWLFNNDAVAGPETLCSLVKIAESDERIGLATPQIAALEEDRLTFAGGVIDIRRGIYNETHDPQIAARWAREHAGAGLVIGTAMLVRVAMIREIGMLDERFFAYYEDIDYSARSARAGWRNVVETSTVVRHLEKNRNRTPERMRPHYWYYMARNESRFWRKHLGLRGSARLRWYSANGFLRHYNRLAEGNEGREAILAGLWHGWLNRGGAYNPSFHMPALIKMLVRPIVRRAGLSSSVGKPVEARE